MPTSHAVDCHATAAATGTVLHDKAAVARTRHHKAEAWHSIAALVVAYFNSLAFRSLAAETQRTRRNILERFRAENLGATGLRRL
jgi:hypothetical protein